MKNYAVELPDWEGVRWDISKESDNAVTHLDGFDTSDKSGLCYNRTLRNRDALKRCSASSCIEICNRKRRSPKLVHSENSWRPPTRSDDFNVFISTHNGERIELLVNANNLILEVRRMIFNLLSIPLDQWRLNSCGGKLYRDNRTLANYGIEEQGTLYMRLLLKAGGSKPKSDCQKQSAPVNRNGTAAR